MKIIKKGKIKKEFKKTCKNCKTIFVYEKKDVKSDRDGQYVVCPLCKNFIQTN
jgi:RNase P subunit RPR2